MFYGHSKHVFGILSSANLYKKDYDIPTGASTIDKYPCNRYFVPQLLSLAFDGSTNKPKV